VQDNGTKTSRSKLFHRIDFSRGFSAGLGGGPFFTPALLEITKLTFGIVSTVRKPGKKTETKNGSFFARTDIVENTSVQRLQKRAGLPDLSCCNIPKRGKYTMALPRKAGAPDFSWYLQNTKTGKLHQTATKYAGLPDGIFSNQKCQSG
jgi:hypothetical protein